MTSTAFQVLFLLPSFAFVLLALTTVYGVRRAYVALCWVSVTLYVLVNILWQLSVYQTSHVNWPGLAEAVIWTGLSQCALGVALAARAVWREESCVGLLIAACLAAAPYLLDART